MTADEFADIIEEDRRLSKAADDATEDLHRHRWFWTMDEANPDRVSQTEYAKARGISQSTVSRSANAWKSYAEQMYADVGITRSLSDFVEMTKNSDRKVAAAKAYAATAGTTVANVLAHKRDLVAGVVRHATDAAERRGTTIDEEIVRVAEIVANAQQRAAAKSAERKANHSKQWLSIEIHLSAAKRRLTDALKESEGVDFSDDEWETICDSATNCQALLTWLIEMRSPGHANVDWDGELARLSGDD